MNFIKKSLVYVFIVTTLISCRSNWHDRRNAYYWVHDSYEYKLNSRIIYSSAWKWILENKGKLPQRWGVIMDVDETILDNSKFQKKLIVNKLEYSQKEWTKWVINENAELVEGSKEFIKKVRRSGGLVVLVTNRSESLEQHTVNILDKLKIKYDAIYSKRMAFDKYRRWELAIKDLGFTPILWVGDQLSDFPDFMEIDKTDRPACPNFFSSLSYETKEQRIEDVVLREAGKCIITISNPMFGKWIAKD